MIIAVNQVSSLEALYTSNVVVEVLWRWHAVAEIPADNIMTL